MNANAQNPGQVKIVVMMIVLITAYIGVNVLTEFGNTYLSNGIIATILLTAAILLPIRQKRFSFYSVFLIISGVSFLVSGAIDSAYDSVVRPLPVLDQIEFSKVMRPEQVSRGLTSLGSGLIYFLMALAWFQSNQLSQRSESKLPKVLIFIMAVVGILLSISGITSMIEGLSKLQV